MSSFVRQLNYYGFVRLSDRRRRNQTPEFSRLLVFGHPSGDFVRGDASRLQSITRKSCKDTRRSKSSRRGTTSEEEVSSSRGGSPDLIYDQHSQWVQASTSSVPLPLLRAFAPSESLQPPFQQQALYRRGLRRPSVLEPRQMRRVSTPTSAWPYSPPQRQSYMSAPSTPVSPCDLASMQHSMSTTPCDEVLQLDYFARRHHLVPEQGRQPPPLPFHCDMSPGSDTLGLTSVPYSPSYDTFPGSQVATHEHPYSVFTQLPGSYQAPQCWPAPQYELLPPPELVFVPSLESGV